MAANTETPRAIYWVPVLGWMLRDMDAGHKDAPIWGMAVIAMIGGIAGVMFGVWAFLTLFLVLTPIFLIGYAVSAFSAISGDMMGRHEERLGMQARIARNRAEADTDGA